MYRFSRCIYKELAPEVIEGASPFPEVPARQRLLDASEAAMRRLAYDRRYFAHPARSLYTEVRCLFPLCRQLHVYRVIERNIGLAIEHLERLPDDACLDGQPRVCRASTRKGAPCQREPLPGRDYCPSHKHLEEEMPALEELQRVGAAA